MYSRAEVLESFQPWVGEVEPDSYRDFLGVRTRVKYLPPTYATFAGRLEGRPDAVSRASITADPAEMAGVLKAVIDASGSFCCVELGAGWGPFVVGSGVAARRRGISKIRLIAVEGSAAHMDFLRQHFVDNDFDPDQHKLIRAAVGVYDGKARFPRLHDPSFEWGAEAKFHRPGILHRLRNASERTLQLTLDAFDWVPCMTLGTILADVPGADVVHFDIQGGEAAVIVQGADVLRAKAKRLVIGTHGRDLEHKLFVFLDAQGWKLEDEKACTFLQPEGRAITLLQDGVQVWRNPAL